MVVTNAKLTIGKKAASVTAADSKIYGENDPMLTDTVSGTVGSNAINYMLTRSEGENVGEYVITVSLGDNPKYDVTVDGGAFTITAKTVTIKANDQRKTVCAVDPELTYSVEGLAEGDTLTGALTREAGEDMGTYSITQGTLAASGNYVIIFTGATFTICENKVETDVNIDEDAPEMKIENISEEAAGALLTEEEKEAFKKGEEVKIYLEVIAVDQEIVPKTGKEEVEKTAKKSGMKVGMYIDMSLLKQVGSNDAVAIHDTDGNMVKVTITVPENLRNTNPNIKRTFYVVRVHDGKTEILGQSTGDSVSFETDKYSTYSLTYKDVNESSLIWLRIVIAVVIVAAAGVGVFFFIKKKIVCPPFKYSVLQIT